MSCVNIRGCRTGEGRPKVILPIVEHTEATILEKAAQFSTLSADCVEWRVDWFEGFQSPAAIARCIQKLRVALRDKLLLVTFPVSYTHLDVYKRQHGRGRTSRTAACVRCRAARCTAASAAPPPPQIGRAHV